MARTSAHVLPSPPAPLSAWLGPAPRCGEWVGRPVPGRPLQSRAGLRPRRPSARTPKPGGPFPAPQVSAAAPTQTIGKQRWGRAAPARAAPLAPRGCGGSAPERVRGPRRPGPGRPQRGLPTRARSAASTPLGAGSGTNPNSGLLFASGGQLDVTAGTCDKCTPPPAFSRVAEPGGRISGARGADHMSSGARKGASSPGCPSRFLFFLSFFLYQLSLAPFQSPGVTCVHRDALPPFLVSFFLKAITDLREDGRGKHP